MRPSAFRVGLLHFVWAVIAVKCGGRTLQLMQGEIGGLRPLSGTAARYTAVVVLDRFHLPGGRESRRGVRLDSALSSPRYWEVWLRRRGSK